MQAVLQVSRFVHAALVFRNVLLFHRRHACFFMSVVTVETSMTASDVMHRLCQECLLWHQHTIHLRCFCSRYL